MEPTPRAKANDRAHSNDMYEGRAWWMAWETAMEAVT
jgi:hypothetical protein